MPTGLWTSGHVAHPDLHTDLDGLDCSLSPHAYGSEAQQLLFWKLSSALLSMAFQPFSNNSGPALPPATQTLFGASPQPPFSSNPFPNPLPPRQRSPRPAVSPLSRDPRLKTPLNDGDSLTTKQPSAVANFVDAHDSGIRSPVPKVTGSPSLLHTAEASFGSPHIADYDSGRPAVFPPSRDTQSKTLFNDVYSLTIKQPSPVANFVHAHGTVIRFPVKKVTRSPPLLHTAEGSFGSPRIANYDTGRLGFHQNVMFDNAVSKASPTMRSPLPSKAKHAVEEFHSEVSQRFVQYEVNI
ncbi:hypothetical protein ACLOJK_018623 [Asimina triloba]